MVDSTRIAKKLTSGDVRAVFIRSNLLQGSWNFERMQALGFCFSMVPVIRRLYPENDDARKQAIRRHLEFFNTHPYVAAPVLGVTMAMEEQRANGAAIDDGAINGLKVGLMGPLAGVDPGDGGEVAFFGRFICRMLKCHGQRSHNDGQHLSRRRQRYRQRNTGTDALPAGNDQNGGYDGGESRIGSYRRSDIHPAQRDHLQRTADNNAGFHVTQHGANQGAGDQRTVKLKFIQDRSHTGNTGHDKYQYNL